MPSVLMGGDIFDMGRTGLKDRRSYPADGMSIKKSKYIYLNFKGFLIASLLSVFCQLGIKIALVYNMGIHMFRKMTFLFLAVFFLSACAGSSMNANGVLDPELNSTEQATKIGSPTEELPDQTPKAIMEKALLENPNWQGSYGEVSPVNGGILFMEFDLTTKIVSIRSLADGVIYSIGFEVTDEGKVLSSGNDTLLSLSAAARNDSELYPIEVTVAAGKNGNSARMFASTYKKDDYVENYMNGISICASSAAKSYESDAVLTSDAAYYVAGFVVTHNDKGEECALTVFDTCAEEGKMLNEIVPDANSSKGFSVRKVECDCHNGQCMDKVSDEAFAFTEDKIVGCPTGLICTDNGTKRTIANETTLTPDPVQNTYQINLELIK